MSAAIYDITRPALFTSNGRLLGGSHLAELRLHKFLTLLAVSACGRDRGVLFAEGEVFGELMAWGSMVRLQIDLVRGRSVVD